MADNSNNISETLASAVEAADANAYNDEAIRHLQPREHLRSRPGMYIGKTGDGSEPDDGIYILLKETIDNSIDEFNMGFGKSIYIDFGDDWASVRDFGRGIPLGSVTLVASEINTGGKFDDSVFKKSVGMNGVGLKAVNYLSTKFEISSYRDGSTVRSEFHEGLLTEEQAVQSTEEKNGTCVWFSPDDKCFRNYKFREDIVVKMVKNYTYLNPGLTIVLNGQKYNSRNGLLDLLTQNITCQPLYGPIHLKGNDIEVAITHADQYGDEFYSFVNGQHTTLGGTHLTAFKEALTRTIKEFYGKNFDASDIRNGLVAAISIKVQEPEFESQTKTKLGSKEMWKDGPTVAKFVGDFLKKELDNYLHRNPEKADAMLKKIQESERGRKAMTGVAKIAREKAKKSSMHNKKLIDCRMHLNDNRGDSEKKRETSIFLTEGNSAAGSITKIRDVDTQAVFPLRGKPLNTYGASKKVLYENDEFNLLQAALNIENGIEGLRYNKVIIATDADVDGMHIRLLLLTFFLKFFPELVRDGHLFVLQTPLFRVRDKKAFRRTGGSKSSSEKPRTKGRKSAATTGENADVAPEKPKDTYYCYSEQERNEAMKLFGANAEVTRFKGLGEISPEEFRGFIGEDMRADRVFLRNEDAMEALLEYYMGKNTTDRQEFIIDNLIVEEDEAREEAI